MILDAIKDAWTTAKERLGISREKPDLIEQSKEITPWHPAIGVTDQTKLQWAKSWQRNDNRSQHGLFVDTLATIRETGRGPSQQIERAADKPIPNPTLDRDNDQPRLSMKL